jgi:glycosyltransferase involved in cell wall biosynthesis
MHIALLTSANGWRGSAASYAKIARGLAQRGHVGHLITAAPRLTLRLRQEGLPVTEIPGRDTGPGEVLALLRALKRLGAQAIIADTPRDVRLSAYATLLHSARIVYRYNLNYRRPRNHLMDRVYLSRVAACIYQSRYIHEDALLHAHWMGRIPAFEVPNGYDTVRLAPDPKAGRAFRRRYRIPDRTALVLTSAKLARNKGHEIAIAALDLVRSRGTDLIYVICGDGVKEEQIREQARARGLPTIFTGLLASDEVVAALAAADLVVHPSLQEIFPNAVGEAMACGRPVVAADSGGTGELIGRDGCAGLLVPPGSPDALAETVERLLANPGRRAEIGAAARRRIEAEFPLHRMIDGYEAALAQTIELRG